MQHDSENSVHANHKLNPKNLQKTVIKHSLRCLLGCNVGEVSGLVIGSIYGWDMVSTIILAVSLAFTFGYAFTIIPMLKTLSLMQAARVAIIGDTAGIAAMEISENTAAFMIPGFMEAHLFGPMFWIGLGIIIPIGFLAVYPIMYWAMKKELAKVTKASHH